MVMTMKEDAYRLYRTLDCQDWNTLEALIDPNVVIQLGSGPPISFSAWRESLAGFYAGFPDGHHCIDDCIADGDQVVTRCRFIGTHQGAFHGVAPSGKKIS